MSLLKIRKVKTLPFNLELHKVHRTRILWASSNGTSTYVADLNDVHLTNAIKMIEEGRHQETISGELYGHMGKEQQYREFLKTTET